MQTWLGSHIEQAANIAVGFSVAYVANLIVLPAFGYAVTPGDAFNIGLVFTAISYVRGLVIRRYFNGLKFFTVKPREG